MLNPHAFLSPDALILAAGLLSGFCSSTPIGPINLWIADATFSRAYSRILSFISGVIAVDVIFALLAILGYSIVQPSHFRLISFLGGGALILLGASQLRRLKQKKEAIQKPKNQNKFHNTKSPNLWQDAIFGVFLCVTNPAFLMFWLFIVDMLHAKYGVTITGKAIGLFTFGVALGDLGWFYLFTKMTQKSLKILTPSWIERIRSTIALLFVILGFLAIGRSV